MKGRARTDGDPGHFSEHSMSPNEFPWQQNRSAQRRLTELVWQCRDRLVFSHLLHNLQELLPEVVYGRSAIVLDGFDMGWSWLEVGAKRRLDGICPGKPAGALTVRRCR
jgi:hypothetical protein